MGCGGCGGGTKATVRTTSSKLIVADDELRAKAASPKEALFARFRVSSPQASASDQVMVTAENADGKADLE